jgi:6-phosphogluconolactonase
MSRDRLHAYVGTYTEGPEGGIYAFEFDGRTGAFAPATGIGGIDNPSFLVSCPRHQTLYAVSEVMSLNRSGQGGVYAFSVDPETGRLGALNHLYSGGAGPCHVTCDSSGHALFVSNYGSGSLGVLSLGADGRLGSVVQSLQHQGSSIHPTRQSQPHVHMSVMDTQNRFLRVADLGLDRVFSYAFDSQSGMLSSTPDSVIQFTPGSGPRYVVFHPSRPFLFVVCELDSTLEWYRLSEDGSVQLLQKCSTRARPSGSGNTAAHCCVSPDGQFVYVSNRGDDTLAVFQLDYPSGRMVPLQWMSTQGRTPRFFTFDPDGHFVIVANQDTDSIVSFIRNTTTGRLSPTGYTWDIPRPVCIHFLASTQ